MKYSIKRKKKVLILIMVVICHIAKVCNYNIYRNLVSYITCCLCCIEWGCYMGYGQESKRGILENYYFLE